MINDPDNTQDQGLTTERIAAAASPRPAKRDDLASADYDTYDDAPIDAGLASSGPADRGAPGVGYGSSAPTDPGPQAADPAPQASLLDDDELQSMTMRWKDIQAEFVDEPTTAVREADALVAELMQQLAVMFATERAELENRWAGGNQVSTEELRQGLRLYRSFFERLLAA